VKKSLLLLLASVFVLASYAQTYCKNAIKNQDIVESSYEAMSDSGVYAESLNEPITISNDKKLLEAILKSDVKAVKILLEKGYSPNIAYFYVKKEIHGIKQKVYLAPIALSLANFTITELLIQSGADVNLAFMEFNADGKQIERYNTPSYRFYSKSIDSRVLDCYLKNNGNIIPLLYWRLINTAQLIKIIETYPSINSEGFAGSSSNGSILSHDMEMNLLTCDMGDWGDGYSHLSMFGDPIAYLLANTAFLHEKGFSSLDKPIFGCSIGMNKADCLKVLAKENLLAVSDSIYKVEMRTQLNHTEIEYAFSDKLLDRITYNFKFSNESESEYVNEYAKYSFMMLNLRLSEQYGLPIVADFINADIFDEYFLNENIEDQNSDASNTLNNDEYMVENQEYNDVVDSDDSLSNNVQFVHDSNGLYILHEMSDSERVEILKYLNKLGYSINKKDDSGLGYYYPREWFTPKYYINLIDVDNGIKLTYKSLNPRIYDSYFRWTGDEQEFGIK
jgi:hypothetical protein